MIPALGIWRSGHVGRTVREGNIQIDISEGLGIVHAMSLEMGLAGVM